MLDHVSLGSRRFTEAIQFYSDCFGAIGYGLSHRTPDEAAFGPHGDKTFWLYPVVSTDAVVGERSHVAVSVDSREKIIKFHELALERGATTVRVPGKRPDISPDYFGTVIRDLDGHTIEVVHWSTQAETPA
jgi:catechol 2,3-dioxygenase-like lactoylglutathione lyase family enzyme